MKHKLIPLLVLAISCATSSCTAIKYRSPWLDRVAQVHTQVAVLPFEVILVGKLPARLTPAQVAEIERHESLTFQTALYYELLDRSDSRRKQPIRVHLQPVEATNRLLSDNGVSLWQSWSMPAEELAGLLGVDAVVRTRVEKARYLSNAASFAIDAGHHVLDDVSDGRYGWLVPHGLTRTHDIFADASLLNGADGDLLWKVAVSRATDWQQPPNDVVFGITRKLAKKFPYRG